MPAPANSPPPIDGPSNSASLRTLGTGSNQACAGNDSRLITPATPNITIVSNLAASSVNLSTEGTIDWLDNNGVGQQVPSQSSAFFHRKRYGDELMVQSYQWFNGGGGSGWFTGSGAISRTTTSIDDISMAGPLFGVNTFVALNASGTNTGGGMSVKVPARKATRTLGFYVSNFNCVLTCEFSLAGATTVNTTIPTNAARKVTVTYNSATDYLEYMLCKCWISTNTGGGPNMVFYCLTIS